MTFVTEPVHPDSGVQENFPKGVAATEHRRMSKEAGGAFSGRETACTEAQGGMVRGTCGARRPCCEAAVHRAGAAAAEGVGAG